MNKMVDTRNALFSPYPGCFAGRGQQSLVRLNLHEANGATFVEQCGGPVQLLTDATTVPAHLQAGVMMLGNFDGFHRGHQALMAAARAAALAGGSPIGVMSVEPHPRQLFAPHSTAFRLGTPATKAEAFGRFGVEFMYSPRFDHAFAGQEPEEFIDEILVGGFKVSRLVVGHNFRFGRRRRGDVDLLRRVGRLRGFAVTAVEEVQWDDATCSSTRVRDLLMAGDVEGASSLLGHAWTVELGVMPAAVLRSGERIVAWHASVLKPACGGYDVVIRRPNEPGSLSQGRITIDTSGLVSLALESWRVVESVQAPLFADFIRHCAD
ncbi:hypothetical protein ACFFTN_03460 [Aminobacter aganoensis]|uniref:Bifunctional riboflavin kinase/FMN adenylyltransferase n=1 Tax=Aminobacter aganoensis TaxID=83264 RepID=A0A7X0KKJ6_9HYPH|nr:hypothetical protein [Aminobacter aganoensis]MBB6354046.1 riboflavin kinase/FMN adenylyltransferase [Aminobacter aganoensis]